jgi:hypothetical protein
MSGNSACRLARPNAISGRNAPLVQSWRWPVRTELKPTIWPSSSLRCMARNSGAAPV